MNKINRILKRYIPILVFSIVLITVFSYYLLKKNIGEDIIILVIFALVVLIIVLCVLIYRLLKRIKQLQLKSELLIQIIEFGDVKNERID